MLIADPWFYAVAIPAVLFTGISKGGFPGAFGGMAVPLMSFAISPVQAAGIMLPILCLMDIFGLYAYRGTWDRDNMRVMIAGACVGISLGTLAFGALSEDIIRVLVGTIAVGFSITSILGAAARQQPQTPSRPKAAFWSGLSAFTSFLAHAGGPPMMVYLLPLRMNKTLLMGTTVIFFAAVNYLKLVPYGFLGQLSPTNLATSAVLAPLAPLGIGLGVWLHRRVNERLFYRVSYALMFAAGCKLLYDGLTG